MISPSDRGGASDLCEQLHDRLSHSVAGDEEGAALDVVRRGQRFARAVTGEEIDALGERFGHLGDLGHLWQ